MSDPDFDEIWQGLQNSPFADHAKQIGLLCIMWGHLEAAIDLLVHSLLRCADDRSGAIIVNIMDMRDKIDAARAMGFVQKPNDEWYETLDKSLNTTDQTIRPRRNRYVHDVFWPVDAGMAKHQRRAAVVKEQARVKALRLVDIAPVNPGEIAALAIMVMVETQRIRELRLALETARLPLREKPA